MISDRDRPVLEFFASAVTFAGWLMIGLGGLCTLGVGMFASEGRMPLAGWLMPAAILAVGGGLIWAGRWMRKSLGRLERGRRPDE